MDDQILVTVIGDAPVETPFEHGKSLIRRQGMKRGRVVEKEMHLRLVPAAQIARPIYAHMKVGELAFKRMACVMQGNSFREQGLRRGNAGNDRTGAQIQACLQAFLKLGRG